MIRLKDFEAFGAFKTLRDFMFLLVFSFFSFKKVVNGRPNYYKIYLFVVRLSFHVDSLHKVAICRKKNNPHERFKTQWEESWTT